MSTASQAWLATAQSRLPALLELPEHANTTAWQTAARQEWCSQHQLHPLPGCKKDVYELFAQRNCFHLDSSQRALLRLLDQCLQLMQHIPLALKRQVDHLQSNLATANSRQHRSWSRTIRVATHDLAAWLALCHSEAGVWLFTEVEADKRLRKLLKGRLALLQVFATCVEKNQVDELLTKCQRDADAMTQYLMAVTAP
jgi:hypothetical protein